MEKRLFFGLETRAPWPQLPEGRRLAAEDRHLTLAFLGATDYTKLEPALASCPHPPFKVGFVAQFDQCVFFPPHHPRVVAWHVDFLEKSGELIDYQSDLIAWLQERGFAPDVRHSFNPHVTLARAPFNKRVWETKFAPLPCLMQDLHLYESIGGLTYKPIWSYPLAAPFEEISHTADLAFCVRGETFDRLFRHAQGALAYTFPELLPFVEREDGIETLDDVIIKLNELISAADQRVHCPLKAVSFHSDLIERDGILEWEMIVDV